MASAINDNYPVPGNPTTQSVRDNFTIAKNEITNLQSAIAAMQAGGATPGGPAGGVLSGSYPDPGFAPFPVFAGGLQVSTAFAEVSMAGGSLAYTFSSGSPVIRLKRINGSIAAPTTTEDGDPVGIIVGDAHDGTGFTNGPQMEWRVNGTVATGSVPQSVTLVMKNAFQPVTWNAWQADYASGVVIVGKNDAIRTDGTTVELAVPLVLPAAPVGDMEAATKAYVNSLIATVGALEARIARLEKLTR